MENKILITSLFALLIVLVAFSIGMATVSSLAGSSSFEVEHIK